MSLLHAVQMAPSDPILGLNEQFAASTNPDKVNLAVGVYYGEDGKIPLLDCVKTAESKLAAAPAPYGYLPIDGLAAYDAAVKELVFGASNDALDHRRIATIQGLGGTGALKVGTDFLKTLSPAATVLISDPTWANHRAIFTGGGFDVQTYPYYDAVVRAIDFDGMIGAMRQATEGTVVILHACCHNPTGYDISPSQWDEVISVVSQRQLVPFLDMAYQGFGDGIEADRAVIAKFVRAGVTFLAATSFSKNFSLYGERVGGLSVVCASGDEAARVLSQLKVLIRSNYSNPPTHGSKIVATVLGDSQLRSQWEAELGVMRERIRAVRQELVMRLAAVGVQMPFISEQRGMFSYSGLSRGQMVRLRSEFGVFGTDTGRMCIAAINAKNIDHVCRAIAAVAS